MILAVASLFGGVPWLSVRSPAGRCGRRTPQVGIDVGLRDYMLRVYNYMASGLALTGIVAYVAAASGFYAGDRAHAADLARDPGAARAGDAAELPHAADEASAAQLIFWAYAGADGPVAGDDLPGLYRQRASRGCSSSPPGPSPAMSLYGYTTRRDLSRFGSFLFMGLIGIIIASLVNMFLALAGAAIRDLGDRRPRVHRPHRLGHAADQGDVLRGRRRRGRRQEGDHGRAAALSRLHQPVHDADAADGHNGATDAGRNPNLRNGPSRAAGRPVSIQFPAARSGWRAPSIWRRIRRA